MLRPAGHGWLDTGSGMIDYSPMRVKDATILLPDWDWRIGVQGHRNLGNNELLHHKDILILRAYGAVPRVWVAQIERYVDELWVPSRFVRDVFVRGGVCADRVAVIPNGVDTRRYSLLRARHRGHKAPGNITFFLLAALSGGKAWTCCSKPIRRHLTLART
jgi:hypothetical protein